MHRVLKPNLKIIKMKNNILFYAKDTIHHVRKSIRYKVALWGMHLGSDRVFMLGMITGILVFLFVCIPVPVDGMSSRTRMIPEQLEDGDYMQKSYIDNKKVLIKDKNGNVKGYLQRSFIDHRKMLIYDKGGKVKGYLQPDLMDSRKLRFIKK
jgi:hypothetical protein